MEKEMKQYIDIFKALSDKNRLRILLMLRVRPLCVCEISEVLNIAFSTISAHLKLLRNTGLIEDEKDGRWVIYRLTEDNEFFDEILGNIEEKLEGNKQVLNDRKVVSEITREICALKLKEKQHN
jgi:ArsR family transcriptional regulator